MFVQFYIVLSDGPNVAYALGIGRVVIASAARQINDIVSAILLRLKPTFTTTASGTATAIDKPGQAAQDISEAANLKDDSAERNEFFSFGTARVMALNAIKRTFH